VTLSPPRRARYCASEVFFHAAARAEHLDHVAYYESRRAGLGSYLGEFESAMKRICEEPELDAIAREPGIRRLHLRQFPLTVLYREVDGGVQVLAVAHKRRRPSYWVARI